MYLGFYTSGGRKFRPSGGTFGRLWNGPRSIPPCRRNCSFATGILRVFPRNPSRRQVLVMVGCVGDIPRRGEQQQAIALEVLDDLGIARELELLDVESSSSFSTQRTCSYGRFSRMISTLYSFFRRYSSTSNCSTPTTPTITDSIPAFGSRKIWMAPSCAICSTPLTNCLRLSVSF